MWKKTSVTGGVIALALGWALSAQSPAQKLIDDSLRAMAATNAKTLTLWGQGGDGAVGQAYVSAGDTWRWYNNVYFVRGYDFDAKAYRTKRVRYEGSVPPGGGNGTTTPAPMQTQDQVTQANNFNAQIEMAMTPIGFLRMAQANSATLSTQAEKGKGAKGKARTWKVLSFPMMGGQVPATYQTTVKGFIDANNLVQRVEVLISQDFLGDIVWSADFSDWKDFGGYKFPSKIVQRQWEPKIFELNVSAVRINDPVDLAPPAPAGGGAGKGGAGGPGAGKGPGGGSPAAAKGKGPGGPPGGAPAAAAGPMSEDLGGGFWLVTGGYGSIVCNFKDYIMLIEAPSSDARMDQIITEAKRLVPNKPIKYVVNTHFHFDHTGGLRAAVAEGATIITHNANKGLYEKVMANPHTLVPDKLEGIKPRPKAKIMYAGEKQTFTDGTHTVELYHLDGSTHSDGMLIAYLPAQHILLNADEFNVAGTEPTAPVADPNGYQVNLLNQIERLGLVVDRHIPVHLPNDGRKVTQQALRYMAGKQ